MAKGSRNIQRTNSETANTRKPAEQVKKEIVERARLQIRRAVVRLQSMEVRTSENPEGNFELIKAYKAFDEQLKAMLNPDSAEAEVQ